MDYICILVFVFSSSFLMQWCVKKGNKEVTCILLGLLVVLFCGCRKVLGNIPNSDAHWYLTFYESATNYSFFGYLASRNGNDVALYTFFYILANLHFPFILARIIYYIVMVLVVYKIISNNELKSEKTYEFFFFSTNFILADCLMRNALGYSFGWLSLSFWYKTQNKKAVIIGILGTLIHSSCVIVLLYYFFLWLIKRAKSISAVILYVSLYYTCIFVFFQILLVRLSEYSGRLSYYLEVSDGGSVAIATTASRLFALLLLLFQFKSAREFRQSKVYRDLILLIFFSLSVIILQSINGIAYRFLSYFDVANLWIYSYVRNHSNTRLIKIGYKPAYHYIIITICYANLGFFMLNSLTGYGLIPIEWCFF